MKKLNLLGLVFVGLLTFFSFTLSVSAEEVIVDQEQDYVTVPIITLEEDMTLEEMKSFLESQTSAKQEYQPMSSLLPKDVNSISPQNTRFSVGSYSLIRQSPTSQRCMLWIRWEGTILFQDWRYQSITVKDSNLLFPKTYKTFGNPPSYTYIKNYSPGYLGTVYVGAVDIPTDKTSVSVKGTSLQAYSMQSARWLSMIQHSSHIKID